MKSLLPFFTEKHLCHHHDALALLQFKGLFNTNASTSLSLYCNPIGHYSYPKMISWNASEDCCSWDGVKCHQLTGHIVGLDLSCSQLHGVIPANSSLFRLSHLQQLNLAYNDLTGSRISHEFGTLSSLTHLNLSSSNFQGEIAAEISHLSNLISLDLSGNYECSMGPYLRVRPEPSTFHKVLQNLTHLRVLSLYSVNISSQVTMNFSSSLTYLNVRDTGLYGILPTNVFHLPNIQVLLLSGNHHLSGSLPKFNCSIRSALQQLELIDTNFSGILPDSIGCIRSLNSLELTDCQFSGAIPESIGNLTMLSELALAYNHFNGRVPTSISNLQLVESFLLAGNHLDLGQLPKFLANSTMLTNLDVSQNFWVGKFPISVLNLTHLSSLDFSNNLLKGQLGDFESRSLEFIDLSNNQLSGSIPSSIFTFGNLIYLDLSYNNFRGIELNMFQNNPPTSRALSNPTNNSDFSSTSLGYLGLSSCAIKEFPYFLRSLGSLFFLDLSNNKIRGQIPSWFMSMSWDLMLYLNVSHNSLTGTVDQLQCQNLKYLDMSFNLLQGQLSSSICNASSLAVLDLSNNALNSTIPQCLGNSSNQLNILDLGNNRFFGTIPTTFSNDNLGFFIVNDNQLEGPLPRSLANCTSLVLLDLGNNKIDDKFPMWLEALTELQILILKSNRFHGSIGNCKTTSPFPRLRIVDVSCNELTGVLPSELLKNFKAMTSEHLAALQYMNASSYGRQYYYYIHSVSLVIKGVEYNFERFLTTLVALDFSSNGFEGEIPKLIGNLHSIQILNLSHNSLTGHIPRTFGNLNVLESLDLSSNQLEGAIPAELLNLTFLGFLNLSENHLVGRIPRGRQFDTFENDSYQGNLALCGRPLNKDCKDTGAPQPSTPLGFEQNYDSDFFDGFTWKALLLGYGFGLVIGLAMGCLMFSTGKPIWFINLLKRHTNCEEVRGNGSTYKLENISAINNSVS